MLAGALSKHAIFKTGLGSKEEKKEHNKLAQQVCAEKGPLFGTDFSGHLNPLHSAESRILYLSNGPLREGTAVPFYFLCSPSIRQTGTQTGT